MTFLLVNLAAILTLDPLVAYKAHMHAGPLCVLYVHDASLVSSFPSTYSAAGSAGSAGLSSWYHVIRLLLHSAHGSLVDGDSNKERKASEQHKSRVKSV